MRYLAPLLVLIALFFQPAFGHDANHPELDDWYRDLRQPDVPATSCCGEADAYFCDILSTESGVGDDGSAHVHNFCTITDDRDDIPLQRPHVDIGTKIEIPNHKIKWSRDDPQSATDHERNPTPHSIVFLSRNQYVYCFVGSAGV